MNQEEKIRKLTDKVAEIFWDRQALDAGRIEELLKTATEEQKTRLFFALWDVQLISATTAIEAFSKLYDFFKALRFNPLAVVTAGYQLRCPGYFG